MMPVFRGYDWRCPYCENGDDNSNDHYFGEGVHSVTCGICEMEFKISVHTELTFRVLPVNPKPQPESEATE